MIAAEFVQLVLPRVPEFRKSMQEEHQLAAAGLRIMQAHAIHFDCLMLNWRCRHQRAREREGSQQHTTRHTRILARATTNKMFFSASSASRGVPATRFVRGGVSRRSEERRVGKE